VEKRAKKGRTTNAVMEPIKERKPRTSFCSSVKERSVRQRAEANARGPPNSRRIRRKTMPGK